MSSLKLKQKIIEKFGLKKYTKAKDFPNNNVTLVLYEKDPLMIRSIILENEREFHLIIDEEKYEIYHDCPTFLIYSETEEKTCIHLIKILLIIDSSVSLEILDHFQDFNLTSEDFGSNKKSTNYLLLAKGCFSSSNNVEGLSYLNKAIITHTKCEPLIERYLEKALKENLLIEFFEFLSSAYQNELGKHIKQYNSLIKTAFEKLLRSLNSYSLFNLLRIIESLTEFLSFYDLSLLEVSFNDFNKLTKSEDFKEKYFSFYFIFQYQESLRKLNDRFKHLLEHQSIKNLKNELVERFNAEIENFAIIDKLKLMKNHFSTFNVSKNKYLERYENYKQEIKELEKKLYLKKFAFLKFLMKKFAVKKTKVNFRKKRNMYVVSHHEENLEKPAYLYIIRNIGFFGLNDSTIKSSDLGINYFIVKELFSDDFNKMPDIFYYKNQYWGDKEHEIDAQEGISLLTMNKEHSSLISQKSMKDERISLIEWDLAKKPRQGSIVNASSSQIIIPDQNNPLFHDLKPFDLCYIKRNPLKIEGDIIKTVNVTSKCSFKDAIESVSKGMPFIEGYYPLSMIKLIVNKKISPFKANEIVSQNPNRKFIPKYKEFIKAFREFLFEYIKDNRQYVFQELKKNPEENTKQILILFDLTNELSGINLDFTEIIKKLLDSGIELKDFRSRIIEKVHTKIQSILASKEIGSTKSFELKKMKYTPFIKYSDSILSIRRNEFEKSRVIKENEEYDISEIKKTYYGEKFAEILNIRNSSINYKSFRKFKQFASKLNLIVSVKQIPNLP